VDNTDDRDGIIMECERLAGELDCIALRGSSAVLDDPASYARFLRVCAEMLRAKQYINIEEAAVQSFIRDCYFLPWMRRAMR
jgi:hypothetical protein